MAAPTGLFPASDFIGHPCNFLVIETNLTKSCDKFNKIGRTDSPGC
jgi:hypothetical protein